MSGVLIIGGGVIGLAVARELHKSGFRDVTVLDRGGIGRESSYAAAGMLVPQAEAERADDFFRFCSESRNLYPDLAAELLEETRIDIELDRSGTLYNAFSESDVKEIRARFKWQREEGLEVERLTASETRKLEPFISPDSAESLYFPNDWQVENRKLVEALYQYCRINGIGLFTDSKVEQLIRKGAGVTTAVIAGGKEIHADYFVIAAGAWSSLIKVDESPGELAEVRPVRGQMISFRTAKRLFTRVVYSPRGYLVPRRDGTILAGATVENAGYDNRTTDSGVNEIQDNALEISPVIANLSINEKWSGLRPFANDGLPIIGKLKNADNLFAATAHYRNGILLAPITAKILVDKLVRGVDSKYLALFGPDRVKSAIANL